MRKLAVVVCALMMSVAMSGQSKHPMVGTWKLDMAQTKNPVWTSATWKFTKDTNDEIAFRLSGTSNDGSPFDESFTGKKGQPKHMTGSGKRTVMTWNKDGSFSEKAPDGHGEMHASVSEDHNTITVEGKWTGNDGKVDDIHHVWRRAVVWKKVAKR